MKILILADSMQTGGAETHIYELSRSLLSLSHEVVVLSRGGEMATKLQKEGVRQIRGTGSPFCLYRTIRAEKPTILHAHTRKTAFLCRLLSPFLSVPCVFTAHARFRTGGMGRLIALFRGKTIAVSQDIANHMEDFFEFQKKDITVIGNGIDTDFFAPMPPKKQGELHIVTISRLDRDCALAATLLLQILPVLRQSFPICLTVVGGGNALPEIENAAKTVEGVTFAGQQTDVRPYLRDCDIFVGVSRAALEAMAMEKPVILCGNEGYLGVLDEHNMPIARQSNFCARGHRAPSADLLLRDILSLLSLSAEHKKRMGQYCRSQVLTSTAMARKTLDVYRAALREYNRFDILLCGYYGFGNTGDELVLRALARGIHEVDPHLRIAALMGKGSAPEGVIGIPRCRLRAIRRSGAVFLGGGTLLQSATSRRSLYYYLSLLVLARQYGKPYGLLLGGIGPIDKAKDRARTAGILQHAALIGLRDAASVSLLAEMGVSYSKIHVGADPVLYLPLPDIARIPQYLTIFPRRGDGQNTALIRAALHISAQYSLPIRIGIMDAGEDSAEATQLASALSAEIVEDRFALICHSRLVITSRLHALILAYRYGVPAVSLSRDPKLAAFLREGFSKDVATMLSRPTEQACHFALANAERLKTERSDRYDSLCRRAWRQIALLVENFH